MNTSNKIYGERYQRGVSLIELMVALLIGLLVTAGAVQLFIGNKRTYRLETALARLQETGRYIVDSMAREIRMAGFAGCSSRSIEPNIIASNPFPSQDSFSAVRGYESSGNYGWRLLNYRTGTDVIRIQRAGDCSAQLFENNNAQNARIRVSFPNGCGFAQNQPALITDCIKGDIFQISKVTSPSNNQGSGGSGGNQNQKQTLEYDSSVNDATGFNGGYSDEASVFAFRSYAYYIAKSDIDSDELSLWMVHWMPRDSNSNTDFQYLELAPGVEDMQITYGVNDEGGEYAIAYVVADDVTDWSVVRSVRLNFLLRSDDRVTEKPRTIVFNGSTVNGGSDPDQRLRMVYTLTVALRNRLP